MTPEKPSPGFTEHVAAVVQTIESVRQWWRDQQRQGPSPATSLPQHWSALRTSVTATVMQTFPAGAKLALQAEMDFVGHLVAILQNNDPQTMPFALALLPPMLTSFQQHVTSPPSDPVPRPENVAAAPLRDKGDPAAVKAAVDAAVGTFAAAETSTQRASWFALAAGVLLAFVAAVLPLTMRGNLSGWQLVAGWGARILGATVVTVAASRLFVVFRDLAHNALQTRTARARTALLTAAPFFGEGSAVGAALIEHSKQLESLGRARDDAAGLFLPQELLEAALKHAPELAKAFRGGESK